MSATFSISCSCCGGKEGQLFYENLTSVYTEKPYSLFRCISCSNLVTMPVIGKEELSRIYTTTYLYPVHRLAIGEKKYRARAMADFVRHSFPPSGKKLLEVGCMFGFLMDELKNDYHVRGIEIGSDAVNYCHEKGLDVADISIESYLESTRDKFDIIILSHVLEHLLHPEEVLKKLIDRLNPGGLVLILVPNYLSIQAKLFGRYWGWWQVPVHINHFNEKALEHLTERSGYSLAARKKRGGDSLMLLLNLVNLFHVKNKNIGPGLFQKIVIRLFTTVFRFWYLLGNEEITMVLKKKE